MRGGVVGVIAAAACLAAVWVSGMVFAAEAVSPADRAERERLVGFWKGYTVEGKGENPDTGPVKIELTITDRVIRGIQIKDAERIDHGEGAYRLDLSTTPRCLDASKTNARGRRESYTGIYSLEGDTLRWCVSRKQRPTAFDSAKGQFLLILKRERETPAR